MGRKRALGDSPIGNALILAKAGLSLIRGSSNVDLGWEDTPRTASLLCFDEARSRSSLMATMHHASEHVIKGQCLHASIMLHRRGGTHLLLLFLDVSWAAQGHQ